ncbi:MAG: hypothetical protein OXL95_09705 [Nitrospira sp.]|nr:hypothetical protein [Nitrospira sp.]
MMILNRRLFPALLPTILGIGLLCLVSGGCGEWPQGRLDTFLGQQPEDGRFAVAEWPKGPVHAGLWVINDTGAPGSAPKLSETAFTDLTEHVRQQLLHAVPIKLRVVRSSDPGASPPSFSTVLRWGQDQRVDYLVLAILSSAEIEVPERFPWRGSTLGAIARGLQFGYRAENLALAELALVDVRTGHVLVRVEGNAWASLDRLDPPIESNEYPVVRRNLEDPPIYPEKEADAHDVMRAVAAGDAINQAVLHLKEAWGGS